MQPAASKVSSTPSRAAASLVLAEAGATSRRTPGATRRPDSTAAAMRRSSIFAPTQAPI